jgi:hypothetical protein
MPPQPTLPPGLVNAPFQLIPGVMPSAQPWRNVSRPEQKEKYFAYVHSLALGAAAVQQRVLVATDSESDFAFRKVSVLADNRGAKIQFVQTPLQEAFQSLPVYLSLYGSGRLPFLINPPIMIPRAAQYTQIFDDRRLVQVGTNNVSVVSHGAKMYDVPFVPRRRYQLAKPFIPYVANFTADDIAAGTGGGVIPANGAASYNIRIDNDSDFEVQKLTLVSDGPVLIQIISDNDNWFLQAIRGEHLGGTTIEVAAAPGTFSGELPFILPAPRFIPGAGYITVQVSDVSGAANRCMVGFTGVRLYPRGGHPF